MFFSIGLYDGQKSIKRGGRLARSSLWPWRVIDQAAMQNTKAGSGEYFKPPRIHRFKPSCYPQPFLVFRQHVLLARSTLRPAGTRSPPCCRRAASSHRDPFDSLPEDFLSPVVAPASSLPRSKGRCTHGQLEGFCRMRIE